MSKLKLLSELAHKIYDENKPVKIPDIKSGIRYYVKPVYYRGVFDYIIWDSKTKRYLVNLTMGSGVGTRIEGLKDIAFYKSIKNIKVLIHQ